MPESPPVPTPEQLWRWMLSRNIRINIFPQSRIMSWDTTVRISGTRPVTTSVEVNTDGSHFYCVVRYREAGPAIFKAHSFATPGEAYDAAWRGLMRYALEHPEEWQPAEGRVNAILDEIGPLGPITYYAEAAQTHPTDWYTVPPSTTGHSRANDIANANQLRNTAQANRLRTYESQMEEWYRRRREGF